MAADDTAHPERAPGFEIRPFRTTEEYRACVQLQEDTWGAGFSERVSSAVLIVSQRLGGVAAGAYDESEALAGFVFGMTGLRDGETVHWSDMLAVRPALRDTGLGRTLKWYQRRVLLDRGITTMYWTFDPLESRNAHLNLNRLGVVVREYVVNMYGSETDSPLHAGIGTDRFVPIWRMDSARVEARWEDERRRREGEPPPGRSRTASDADLSVLDFTMESGLPLPGQPRLGASDPILSVAIPAEIQAVKQRSLDAAVSWREATRATFSHYLSRGYEVRELVRGEPCSRYLMFREPEVHE